MQVLPRGNHIPSTAPPRHQELTREYMFDKLIHTRRIPLLMTVIALGITTAFAQAPPAGGAPPPGAAAGGGRGGRGPQAPRTAKAAALFDLTGYWNAIVTEDWRYRMVTPMKGDYAGIQLSPEGRKIADAWDPAKDDAAGEQCKSYGAANIMRVPGRIHITWQDDQILKLDTDAGTQTRTLNFEASQAPGGDWQGVSRAAWELVPAGRGVAPVGSLKIVTTKMKPGYLRKNGVPYSANATLTEYFDRIDEPNGDSYLLVTTTVEDPTYLGQPYLTASHFKKQANAAGWNPSACTAR
jgi:hypothetical protein